MTNYMKTDRIYDNCFSGVIRISYVQTLCIALSVSYIIIVIRA